MKRLPIVVILIASLMNLTIGCNDSDRSVPSSGNVSNVPGQTRTEDSIFIDCNTGTKVQVTSSSFTTYNNGTQSEFEYALENGEVQAAIAKFKALGYSLDLPNSFIVQGEGVPEGRTDTIDVKIANLIMRYLPDTTQGFIWINHRSSPLHPEIQTLVDVSICSFVTPTMDVENYEYVHFGTDSEGIERGMWVKAYVSPFSSGGDMSAAFKGWKDWGLCVVIGTVVGCTICAAGCTLTGPVWAGCTVICCGEAALAAEIACTLCMIFC